MSGPKKDVNATRDQAFHNGVAALERIANALEEIVKWMKLSGLPK
jgi:hypothetical protein